MRSRLLSAANPALRAQSLRPQAPVLRRTSLCRPCVLSPLACACHGVQLPPAPQRRSARHRSSAPPTLQPAPFSPAALSTTGRRADARRVYDLTTNRARGRARAGSGRSHPQSRVVAPEAIAAGNKPGKKKRSSIQNRLTCRRCWAASAQERPQRQGENFAKRAAQKRRARAPAHGGPAARPNPAPPPSRGVAAVPARAW